MDPLWATAELEIQFPRYSVTIEHLPDIHIEAATARAGEMEFLERVRQRKLVMPRQVVVIPSLPGDMLAVDVARRLGTSQKELLMYGCSLMGGSLKWQTQ